MTSIESVFEILEDRGLVYRSLNNELNISISLSDYLDLKKLVKEMHKQEIINAHDMGYIDGGNNKKITAEMYYDETFKK